MYMGVFSYAFFKPLKQFIKNPQKIKTLDSYNSPAHTFNPNSKCSNKQLNKESIMDSMELERKLRTDLIRIGNQVSKKEKHVSDLLVKTAKRMKLGVFGEGTYEPQAPYFMGLKDGRMTIFRNDFYQNVVATF